MTTKTNISFVSKYKIKGITDYKTLADCLDFLKKQTVLGIDIETTRKFERGTYNETVYQGGLDPYLSNIVMLQIGTLQRVFVIDVRDFTNEELKPLTNFLNYNNDILLVGHNLKFEGKHLKHNYDIRLKNVWDTMLVEMNLTLGLPLRYSLADLAGRYLGIRKVEEITLFDRLSKSNKEATPFEIEDKFFIDKSTRLQFLHIKDHPFTKTQVLYGADDIFLPLLIRQQQLQGRKLPSGEIYNPMTCHKIENTFSQVLADIEVNGMCFDKLQWLSLAKENKEIYKQRKRDLEDYIIQLYPTWRDLTLFSQTPECLVDWGSSKKVASFFKDLKICPKEHSKQTGKMDWTVGAEAFLKKLPKNLKITYLKNKWIGFDKENNKYIENHEKLILAYLLLKKSEQLITTFGEDWVKYVHPITQRVHSSYRQILNTGRMSSTNPNCQNLPGGNLRGCFPPTEGNLLLNADYSAQEVRIVAELSKDQAMYDFFVKGDAIFGDDYHSFTATKMFRIMESNPNLLVQPKEINGKHNELFTPQDEEKRGNSKSITFKINYGGSAHTLKDDFGVEEAEAQVFIDSYFSAFPGVRDDFARVKKTVIEQGFVLIDKSTDRRWFCPYFTQMQKLYEKITSYFPEDYFSAEYPQNKRNTVKNALYKKHPFIKGMWGKYFHFINKLERTGLNYRIQGTAATMMKVAMNILRHQLITNKNNSFILTNLVHDECLGESTEVEAKINGKLLSDTMVQGGSYFCKNIPMKAETTISKKWHH